MNFGSGDKRPILHMRDREMGQRPPAGREREAAEAKQECGAEC